MKLGIRLVTGVACFIVRYLLTATAIERHPHVCRPSDGRDSSPATLSQAYNVAVGDRTILKQLFSLLRNSHQGVVIASKARQSIAASQTVYRDFRSGDVRHSLADISKARRLLGYEPTHSIDEGIAVAMPLYICIQIDCP